jgi:hypothetical protein
MKQKKPTTNPALKKPWLVKCPECGKSTCCPNCWRCSNCEDNRHSASAKPILAGMAAKVL